MPINAECNPTDACTTYICSDGYELNSATTTIRLVFKFEKNKKMGIMWFENHNSDVCIDINECDRGTHNCDLTVGICQNLVGTFVCNCPISHYMQLSNATGINECNLINCKPGFTNLGNVFHINLWVKEEIPCFRHFVWVWKQAEADCVDTPWSLVNTLNRIWLYRRGRVYNIDEPMSWWSLP